MTTLFITTGVLIIGLFFLKGKTEYSHEWSDLQEWRQFQHEREKWKNDPLLWRYFW